MRKALVTAAAASGLAAVAPFGAGAATRHPPPGGAASAGTGSIRRSGRLGRTAAEHRDGKAWKLVASPKPGSPNRNQFLGVTAKPGYAWAVGAYYLVEHWNGETWQQMASPSPASSTHSAPFAVASPSPGNAWAVADS